MAKSKTRHVMTKIFGAPIKPYSPEISGVVYPRWLVPGRELDCVLTGIKDAQAILDELRRGKVSHRSLVELCEAMSVLDAARSILAWKIKKT